MLSPLPVAGSAVLFFFLLFSLTLHDDSITVGVGKTVSFQMGVFWAVINVQWSASARSIHHEVYNMSALVVPQ